MKKTNYLTFKDVKFRQHANIEDGQMARIILPDGTDISIVTGTGTYSGNGTYEVMSSRFKGEGDQVRGWLTEEEITRHMIYCQKNPRPDLNEIE